MIFKCIIVFVAVIAIGVIGYFIGSRRAYKRTRAELEKNNNRINSLNFLYEVSSRWILAIEKKVDIVEFFKDNSIQTVAVYGMGRIGKALVRHLKDNEINVLYGIDIRKDKVESECRVYSLEDELPEVEIIIVTVWNLEKIKNDLYGKTNARIISIEDILKVTLGE